MKPLKSAAVLFAILLQGIFTYGQNSDEQEIRSLEQQEVRAILQKDTATLFKLWAPEFIVNNPANIVVTKREVVELLKGGKIDYESFDRTIETISVIDNTAIVMGSEGLKPQGVTDNKGMNVKRRFTNVWLRRQGQWKLVGRQATISSLQKKQ